MTDRTITRDRYELTFGCGWHTGEITVDEHQWPGKRLRTSWNKISGSIFKNWYLA